MKLLEPSRLGTSLLIVVAVLFATAAMAQQEVGALYGTVTDTDGAPLPGVSVSLDLMGAQKVQVSDGRGRFHFLGLDPGNWSLEAKLEGFSTVEYPVIDIRIAANTTVEIQMPAAVEEVIIVTAESPLLDERKISQGSLLRQVDLEVIPTARDPWAVVNQAAGVIVDRVNVGGSESGQQSGFRIQASTDRDNDYLLDGVQITDMAGWGGSSTYYDFDQFAQIELSTGGSEITKHTPGVSLNLVTKRGSNEFRGSARFLLTDDAGYFGLLEQAEPGFSESDLGPGQTGFVGNTVDRIEDYGFEAGGPLWRDRVWLWGSWANNDIAILTGGGDPDRTVLENTSVKLNAQLSAANSLVGSFNNGNKKKWGRGGGPNFDPSSTWDQRGPTGITRLEDTHLFGANLVLTGQYSFVDGGFGLQAQGGAGPDQPPIPDPGGEASIDATGYWRNTASGSESRPTTQWQLDGSWFFNTGTVNHELKFGGRLREAEWTTSWSYPGRNIFHQAGNIVGVQAPDLLATFGLPPDRYLDAGLVYAYRAGPTPTVGYYDSAWVQDTLSTGPWTLNVGLRYDRQKGENEPATVAANLAFPEVVPALSYPGDDAGGLEWTSLSPRLGVTYALGPERKTLLRGSLSRFAGPLFLDAFKRTNPVWGQGADILFLDQPGGHPGFYDDGEPWVVLGGSNGFDPANPTALESSNRNDPNMDPPIVTEAIVGVEHSFKPELVAGLSLTWRRRDDYFDIQRLFTDLETGETRTASAAEYVPDRVVSGTLPDGRPYAVPTYAANPGLAFTGGDLFTTGDRSIDSLGASLTVTKRLSQQWMLRGYLNYNLREEWQVPASFFDHNDPNRVPPNLWPWGNGSVVDGETFVTGGLQSTWQWNLNGMYQVAPDRPWGFNLAANLYGRQGYPIVYTRPARGQDGIGRSIVVVDDITDFRYPDILTTDLRLEKEFRTAGNTSLTFSLDGFNIFNQGQVLSRVTNLAAGRANWVNETVSPRIWRLGVRLNWR
jgi:hypothetical protein